MRASVCVCHVVCALYCGGNAACECHAVDAVCVVCCICDIMNLFPNLCLCVCAYLTKPTPRTRMQHRRHTKTDTYQQRNHTSKHYNEMILSSERKRSNANEATQHKAEQATPEEHRNNAERGGETKTKKRMNKAQQQRKQQRCQRLASKQGTKSMQ